MLRGRRVVLAPLLASDCDQMLSWIQDRNTVILSAPYRPVGPAAHRAWFEAVQQREDVAIFGIRMEDTDELIGSCQLNSIHRVHRTAELQVRIGLPERRRQGLGTEALKLLLGFAFDDLGLHRVQLHTFSTNAAAIGAYRKLGFVTEGILRQAAYVDGTHVDVVVMGLLAEDRTTGPDTS